jgi:hypothetical protein
MFYRTKDVSTLLPSNISCLEMMLWDDAFGLTLVQTRVPFTHALDLHLMLLAMGHVNSSKCSVFYYTTILPHHGCPWAGRKRAGVDFI